MSNRTVNRAATIFGKIIEIISFAFAWAFAIIMVSAIPFLVVSMISEHLGFIFTTCAWLGIAAGAIAVYVVIINGLLTRSYQRQRLRRSPVMLAPLALAHANNLK